MAYKDVDTALILGYKILNDCIDDNAAIAITKLGTRTKRLSLGFGEYTNANTSSVGVFPTAQFVDSAIRNIYASIPLPSDYANGDIKIVVVWKTAATANNVKFQADIKSHPADGSGDTASEVSITITDTPAVVAGRVKKSEMTLPAANVAVGDQMGIRIYRDPADAADDLATDVYVLNTYLEYTARG